MNSKDGHKGMRKLTLYFLLVIVLMLSGCKGGGGIGTGKNKQVVDADIRKGFDGLLMDFLKNAPPDKVFAAESVYIDTNGPLFPIALSIKNQGATDIRNGYLSIGLERELMELTDKSEITINLEGKRPLNPKGMEDVVHRNARTKKIGSQSETHPTTIYATACYLYQTILATTVCVDTDPFNLANRKKVCTASDQSFGSGQGAPVAVTKIEYKVFPSEDELNVVPFFYIHVENRGKGEVILSEKIQNACSNRALGYTDFNRIRIETRLAGQLLKCRVNQDGEQILRLRDKKDVITCSLEGGLPKNSDPYTTPLEITLDYGYTFTISKDVIIEKILKY